MPLNENEHGLRLLGIGTDTEVFLQEIGTGKPIPVCGLLGGTKESPRPVIGPGFSVQEDNVMAEFNVPATDQIFNFISNLETMRNFLRTHFKKHGLDLLIKPACFFDTQQLNNKQAQTFGCEPDYNAWELEENEVDPSNPILRKMRTAGGHVHVSFMRDGQVPQLSDVLTLVKAFDVFLGIPSILLDQDTDRRQVYGKSGAFRPKKYAPGIEGVEYRTLSNFWFKDGEHAQFVYTNVCGALNYINHCGVETADERLNANKEYFADIINGADKIAALDHLQSYGIWMPPSWSQAQEKPRSRRIKNLSPETLQQWTATYGGGIVGAGVPHYIIADDLNEEDEDTGTGS